MEKHELFGRAVKWSISSGRCWFQACRFSKKANTFTSSHNSINQACSGLCLLQCWCWGILFNSWCQLLLMLRVPSGTERIPGLKTLLMGRILAFSILCSLTARGWKENWMHWYGRDFKDIHSYFLHSGFFPTLRMYCRGSTLARDIFRIWFLAVFCTSSRPLLCLQPRAVTTWCAWWVFAAGWSSSIFRV